MTAIYRHYDRDNQLLYVGISKDPFRRLGAHMAAAAWASVIDRMTVEWAEDRDQAIRLEKQYIKAEQPHLHQRLLDLLLMYRAASS